MHDAASLVHATPLPVRMEPAPATSPLRELTVALARGDDAAWAEFHRDYGPGIFRHLLAETRGDHDLASEALQQTYLRLARYARPCEEAAMFGAWLRIVTRTALSDCRRRRWTFWERLRHREVGMEAESANVTETENEAALSAALDRALAQLDEADRRLLEQKYFAGVEVRAIAAQLDVTPKAVESRLTRARAELRRLLNTTLKRHE